MEIILDRPLQIGESVYSAGEKADVQPDIAKDLISRSLAYPARYSPTGMGASVERLATCIMPTKNRRQFIPRAIACFLAQTYSPRELLILDNGEPIKDLIPKDDRIRYMRLNATQTTGQLRNFCCQMARGEFIAHWDDDDWSHPLRLEEQIASLGDKNVTGYKNILFHGPKPEEVQLYKGVNGYAVGTSLLFRRTWWEGNRFTSQNVGEDAVFVERARGSLVLCDGVKRMVASTHGSNTSPRMTKNKEWSKVGIAELPEGYACQSG